MTPEAKEERLVEFIAGFRSAIVAFSGGVDSSYLAFMCHRTLGDRAHSVTALSPAVSSRQRSLAREFASEHKLRHFFIETAEVGDPQYAENPLNRCYFCKSELYGHLLRLKDDWKCDVIFDGANRDDRSDFRPGHRAARESRVVSPLDQVEMGKQEIRELSKKWALKTWDEPAMPCLSSRFPYGVGITPEKLSQVEQAEAYLRSNGLINFRVRHHGDLARIEVATEEFAKLFNVDVFEEVATELKSLGYRHVTLDLRGFRSGSLNEVPGTGSSGKGSVCDFARAIVSQPEPPSD